MRTGGRERKGEEKQGVKGGMDGQGGGLRRRREGVSYIKILKMYECI